MSFVLAGSALWLVVPALLLAAGAVAPWGRLWDGLARWRARRRQDRVTRWLRIGDLLFDVREFDWALAWYERIVDAYPDSREAWNSVAACLEEMGDHAGACEAYLEAYELMPEGDLYLLSRAVVSAWRAGDETEALALWETLAQRDPETARRRLEAPEFVELRGDERVQRILGSDDPGMGTSYA